MIRYCKLIVEYLSNYRTWLILGFTALVPYLFAGLFLRPMEEMFVILNIREIGALNVSFWDIYLRTTGFTTSPFMTFLSLLVLLCTVTVLVATVDRHMRIGDLKFRNPSRRINENFWVVFPILAVLIIVKELFDLLALLFAYLWISITTGSLTLVLIVVSYVLVYGLFCVVVASCIMWIPHTLNTGLAAFRTFSAAVKLVRGKIMTIALMIGIPAIFIAFMNLLGIALGGVANMVTATITYFLVSIYLIVMMYVVYYDTTELSREDLKKVSIWKKPYVK